MVQDGRRHEPKGLLTRHDVNEESAKVIITSFYGGIQDQSAVR